MYSERNLQIIQRTRVLQYSEYKLWHCRQQYGMTIVVQAYY